MQIPLIRINFLADVFQTHIDNSNTFFIVMSTKSYIKGFANEFIYESNFESSI